MIPQKKGEMWMPKTAPTYKGGVKMINSFNLEKTLN
jgi:hypothetical protein